MRIGNHHRRDDFEISVVPLIDVLLVLLIIPARGYLARWRSLPLLATYALVVGLLAG